MAAGQKDACREGSIGRLNWLQPVSVHIQCRKMSSGGAELIADLYVALPADVILFYPDDPSIFLVGTYLLDEVTRKRRGKIFVFQILSNDGSVDTTENHKELDQVECDAVLDMKWYRS